MAQINQLPLEVIRMILQELYAAYCREGNIAWSFSDAMKVHPVWQSIGNEIIYEEISRIMKQRTTPSPTGRRTYVDQPDIQQPRLKKQRIV